MEKLENNLENETEENSSVTFRDVILLSLMGLAVIMFIILPLINPPKKKENETIKIPGQMVIEMIWDNERNIDMDLWVQAPDEPPVGFSNKTSLTINLLRDDLGNIADISGLNYEHSFARSLKKGTYVINAHSFRWDQNSDPLEVKFIITFKTPHGGAKKQLFRKLEFTDSKQEKTVLSFELDEEGNLIDDSISKDYIPLLSRLNEGMIP